MITTARGIHSRRSTEFARGHDGCRLKQAAFTKPIQEGSQAKIKRRKKLFQSGKIIRVSIKIKFRRPQSHRHEMNSSFNQSSGKE